MHICSQVPLVHTVKPIDEVAEKCVRGCTWFLADLYLFRKVFIAGVFKLRKQIGS